ncbi:DUF4270 domain-containing protein [Empedobacter brevis]|uniref:DUF4270 domain-containing protein n=1 Tax=Empedobacter brevis TaxID=247 RepID=A0AAJ1QFY8_9FLAO|nr:DUF4270 family protein [Empedobacter brevis]MDM1073345.1 DUF4270 domain-containing protein [Empedobacter brevis]QHC83755.1 hypothetical protein AS589_02605 [Empedobacter brevis]
MKKFLNVLSVSVAMMIGMGAIVSCENETLGLDNNVIGGEADGNVKSLDVIAFNAEFDTLRTDRFVLQNGAFGVYSEPIFGSTSSKFYTQLRPSSIGDQDFGTETKVDSVNLIIPVYYNTTKDPISKDTINLSKPGEKPGETDTIQITTKYAVDSLYGNKDLKMTLKIKDINTILYRDSKYFSTLNGKESPISTNERVIGTATIGNTVIGKVVKQRNGSSNISEQAAGYKVALDKDYFDEKIIKNAKTGLLSDYATFIRENIKGLEFSVEESNGFIVNFNPNKIDLKMYYSYKNPTPKKDSDKDYKERLNVTYGFDFTNQWNSGTANNANIIASQIVNNTTGSVYSTVEPDTTAGDARLYLSGMSGNYAQLKIDSQQLNDLKTEMTESNITILGAKLKFYIDDSYGFPKPPYLVAWNNYTKDDKKISELYADVLEFYNSYPNSVHFNPKVTGKTDFYTIDITKHLKSMLEKGNEFKDQVMYITMGNFITSVSDATTINSTNPYQNNRAYNPYRVVLHGNKTEDDAKKLKLLVYYSKK